ncbi:hypothetical protein L1987_64838 [Smallanthus sonchifolius]|uniref:Uncharacterized protein n=1 Tax=Smallanthus sonchifolius TaxID=185202 RepID=A0ACB9BSX0_9ASTR|nr:hypothetical protein L1987_64838 [Smallanthus sonchifolius]
MRFGNTARVLQLLSNIPLIFKPTLLQSPLRRIYVISVRLSLRRVAKEVRCGFVCFHLNLLRDQQEPRTPRSFLPLSVIEYEQEIESMAWMLKFRVNGGCLIGG